MSLKGDYINAIEERRLQKKETALDHHTSGEQPWKKQRAFLERGESPMAAAKQTDGKREKGKVHAERGGVQLIRSGETGAFCLPNSLNRKSPEGKGVL